MKSTNLLISRTILYNITASATLALAYVYGYVDMVLAGDPTGIVLIIAAMFILGTARCCVWTYRIGQALDQIPHGPYKSKLLLRMRRVNSDKDMNICKMELSTNIASIRHIASSLVILGLIGTVMGFIIALSGVDPGQAANIEAIPIMVSTLVSGMSTALYTTLVGSILNMWLMMNYYMMNTGLVQLMSKVFK